MTDGLKILVGKIVAAQGLKGEVRVQTFTENPSDFINLNIISDGLDGKKIKFVRALPGSDVIILRVDGIDNRDGAESLRGTELFVNRSDLPALKDDEYYQADLIGMKFYENTVIAVQNFGAGDILELDNGEMVSFTFVKVDMAKREITYKD